LEIGQTANTTPIENINYEVQYAGVTSGRPTRKSSYEINIVATNFAMAKTSIFTSVDYGDLCIELILPDLLFFASF
jgi:hypothetical protein